MSSEHPDAIPYPPQNKTQQPSTSARNNQTAADQGSSTATERQQATVVVRGETVRDPEPKSSDKAQDKSPLKEVSEAKVKLQSRLPGLDDDDGVNQQKDQVVTRDGKADLAFTGTLLASAAPSSAPKGKWQEYRIYKTTAGKHVFSKVSRSVYVGEQDGHTAEIFDPTPASMPSQLLRSARDLTRSRPFNWTDAAVEFFGYDPLAKALYRKLGSQFEEHIG